MTYPNELTNPAQANWPVRVNEGFKSLRGPALYSHNDLTTTGLTEGFFGGDYGATAIADGTVALTNSTTNYVVAHRTTGAVTTSTATTNWNDTATYGRVRRCVTAGGVTTARIDWRFIEGGIFDRTTVAGLGVVATDAIWDAAGDLVHGTGSNTGTRLAIGAARQALLVNAGATAPEWGSVDSDDVTYTPTVLADWDGAADPGDVEQALDQLAERVKDVEIGGAGSVSPSFNFKSDTGSTADSDPGAGLLKWNNATQASATFIYIDDVTDDTATDLSTFFTSLGSTGFLHLIQLNNAANWQLWKWTAVTDGTGYFKFAVTLQASAASFADDVDLQVLFIGAGGGGSTQGKHAIYIAAGSMRPSVTGGCAVLATVASAANQPDIVSLDFDTTTQEYAQVSLTMPKSWDEGTATFMPLWSHAATTVNFGVVWGLQAVAVSNDDAIAVAYGTAQTSTDTGGTTNDLYAGPESSAITIAGTPAAEDTVMFRLSRDTGNGSDTMAIDARLHGIVLYITTNADTDA